MNVCILRFLLVCDITKSLSLAHASDRNALHHTPGTVTCDNVVTGSTTGGVSTVGQNAPENWWMFTATDGGIYTLNSCGSGFDTYIHVYNRTGSAITDRPSSPVATCDDCGPCGLRTVLTVNLSPGNYWYVSPICIACTAAQYSALFHICVPLSSAAWRTPTSCTHSVYHQRLHESTLRLGAHILGLSWTVSRPATEPTVFSSRAPASALSSVESLAEEL